MDQIAENYAALIRAVEAKARERCGNRQKLAQKLGFTNHRSLGSSLEPGGLALDTLLKIVDEAGLASKDRDDLIYAHVLWKLSRTSEGKAALGVLRKSEAQVPAEKVAAFRSWVVRAFLDDFMGTGLG